MIQLPRPRIEQASHADSGHTGVTAAPILSSAPSQLGFSYQISGSVPPSATLQVTSSGGLVAFQIAGTTAAGGPWLQVSSGGTTPGTVTVSVNPVDLIPATY